MSGTIAPSNSEHKTFNLRREGSTLWVEACYFGTMYQAGVIGPDGKHTGGFTRKTKIGAMRAALRHFRKHGAWL